MTTANAVTGSDGRILLGGVDTYGGVKIDPAYFETPIFKAKNEHEWKTVELVYLINSRIGALNKIGRTLEQSGVGLSRLCKYARTGNTYFLKINGSIFRIYGNNVSLIKGKRRI